MTLLRRTSAWVATSTQDAKMNAHYRAAKAIDEHVGIYFSTIDDASSKRQASQLDMGSTVRVRDAYWVISFLKRFAMKTF